MLHRATEVDWPSSGGSDDFVAYNFATATVQGYPPEKIAPIKRQKVGDGRLLPVMTPAVDVNLLPVVVHRTFSEV